MIELINDEEIIIHVLEKHETPPPGVKVTDRRGERGREARAVQRHHRELYRRGRDRLDRRHRTETHAVRPGDPAGRLCGEDHFRHVCTTDNADMHDETLKNTETTPDRSASESSSASSTTPPRGRCARSRRCGTRRAARGSPAARRPVQGPAPPQGGGVRELQAPQRDRNRVHHPEREREPADWPSSPSSTTFDRSLKAAADDRGQRLAPPRRRADRPETHQGARAAGACAVRIGRASRSTSHITTRSCRSRARMSPRIPSSRKWNGGTSCRDKVLRHAKVIVSAAADDPEAGSA